MRTSVIGMFPFTDLTACRTSSMRLAVPARSLRMANVTSGSPNMFAVSTGQYTCWVVPRHNPSWWTLCTTPITSRHATVGACRATEPDTSTECGRGLCRELASEILGDHGHAAARSISLHVTSRPAIIRVPMAAK